MNNSFQAMAADVQHANASPCTDVISDNLRHSLKPPTNPFNTTNSYQRRGSLQEDIATLQEEKSRQIKLMMDNRFREKIRQQLDEEIDRRVREALETPPLEKMARAKEKVVERQVTSSRGGSLHNDALLLSGAGKRSAPLREFSLFSKYSDSSSSLPSCSGTQDERYHLNDDVPFHLTTRERVWLREHKKLFNLTATDFSRSGAASSCRGKTPSRGHELRMAELHQQQQGRLQRLTASQMELTMSSNSTRSDSESSCMEEQSSPEANLSAPIHTTDSAHMAQARALRFSEFNDICDPNGFRMGVDAMENFASLTLREKEVLFSNFTQFGFRDILRTGRLPDGTKVTEVRPGVYRDVYGIERDKHGPFWPKERGPLHPRQIHMRYHCPLVEPLVDKNEPEEKSSGAHGSNRFAPSWKGMQIVFDSEKSPRSQKPTESRDGLCSALIFESRFESGNLRQARRVGQYEYELVLSTDLFTSRHTQWFYFRVSNMQPDVSYKFIIINLLKKSSLYMEGMLPLFYSTKLSQTAQLGWHRKGHHVSYTRNNTRTQSGLLQRETVYYQLKWELEFPCSGDTCYFSHCYPYTFSDLRDDIAWLTEDISRQKYVRKEVLCDTRAGNGCFLLTITQPSGKNEDNSSPVEIQRPGVIVTARVHPGETNASWMMRGLLDFLTSEDPHAEAVRKNFVFKIVPMLNPDGVIVGNYRCSLAARDLNRNYRNPRPESFPTVWHTKRMIAELQSHRKVILYCDLHGHSRKHNVFMYGCDSQYRRMDGAHSYLPSIPTTGVREFMLGRLFPWIMAKQSPEQFSFPGCKFHVHKCKESTGRVVMWRQMNIDNSFTMEATFSGTTINKSGVKRHFHMKDLENIGGAFVKAIRVCEELTKDKRQQNEEILEMARFMFKKMMTASMQRYGMNGRLAQFFNHFMKDEKTVQQDSPSLAESEAKSTTNPVGEHQSSTTIEDTVNDFLNALTLDRLDDTMQLLGECKIDFPKESDSESSDSDSESEPEEIVQTATVSKHKKKKKSKKTSTSKTHSGMSKSKQSSAGANCKENLVKNQPLPMISQENSSKKRSSITLATISQSAKIRENKTKPMKTYPAFTNQYEGRNNGGIPCYSEERLQARANKRFNVMRDKQRKEDDEFLHYMSLLVDDSCEPTFLRQQFQVLFSHSQNDSHINSMLLQDDALYNKKAYAQSFHQVATEKHLRRGAYNSPLMSDLFHSPSEVQLPRQVRATSSDCYGFQRLPSLRFGEIIPHQNVPPSINCINKDSSKLRNTPFPDDI